MISPARLHPGQLAEFRDRVGRIGDPMEGRTDKHVRRLLMHLFAGTAGGFTRLRIVMILLEAPRNAHQLAGAMGMDYKSVQRHLRVMQKNIAQMHAPHCVCHSCSKEYRGHSRSTLHTSTSCRPLHPLDYTHHSSHLGVVNLYQTITDIDF